jgi:secreted PhoX family phosphatase
LVAAGHNPAAIGTGDFTGQEFAGATFDSSGRYLFVNVQTPGITFVITGPWKKGNL